MGFSSALGNYPCCYGSLIAAWMRSIFGFLWWKVRHGGVEARSWCALFVVGIWKICCFTLEIKVLHIKVPS